MAQGDILTSTSEIVDGNYFFRPMLSYIYNSNSQKRMVNYIYKDGSFKKFKPCIGKILNIDDTISEAALVTSDNFYLLTSDYKYILVK